MNVIMLGVCEVCINPDCWDFLNFSLLPNVPLTVWWSLLITEWYGVGLQKYLTTVRPDVFNRSPHMQSAILLINYPVKGMNDRKIDGHLGPCGHLGLCHCKGVYVGFVTMRCISVHQCTSVYISVYQCTSVYISVHQCTSVYISVHQCTSVCITHQRNRNKCCHFWKKSTCFDCV